MFDIFTRILYLRTSPPLRNTHNMILLQVFDDRLLQLIRMHTGRDSLHYSALSIDYEDSKVALDKSAGGSGFCTLQVFVQFDGGRSIHLQ